MNMKRFFIPALVTVLLLSVLVLPVIGAEVRGRFADQNKDGICDNRGNAVNYVDADNDGICDNRSEKACGRQNGCGKNAAASDSTGACSNVRPGCRGQRRCIGRSK